MAERAVSRELGITVSVGCSFNKSLAKLGSDMKKPDAVTVITKDNLKEKVWPLPVSELLFVGPATTKKLWNMRSAVSLTDQEVIDRARAARNGHEFDRLWSGDTSGHEGDDSRADLALCNLLAFWCRKDAGQMDRLFRQSGLMRPKWDEKRGEATYGEITITEAISGCREVYSGGAPRVAPDSTGEEWPQPVPFETISTPDFPTESLPPPVAAFVEALADSTQTPTEMAAVLSLGVLATAFQSRYDVEITPDWKEPLCLYPVAVALPGERKSAVISALTAPVYEYEAQRRDAEAAEVARNQTERALLEKALAAAQARATKKKGVLEVHKEEALELAEQLATFKDKHPFRLLMDDTTPEKLVDIMDAQGGCITVSSAEGGLFGSLMGRYDKGANFDIYLKGHAGDPINVDRIGRKPNQIRNPRLTLILTIQPEVLSGIMGNGTLRGRGLCGRFLYAMCKSKVGHRDVNPEAISPEVKRNYREFVSRILSGVERGTIRLSPEANRARLDYAAAIESRLGGEWEHMRDWGGKLVGAMLRIAALIHAAETTGSPVDTPMSGETIQAAVRISEFLSSHAMAAYQVMGADPRLQDAQYILKLLLRDRPETITSRDLLRMGRRFHKVGELKEPLELLVENDYLRLEEAPAKDKGRGGRPPAPVYRVNPHIYPPVEAQRKRRSTGCNQ